MNKITWMGAIALATLVGCGANSGTSVDASGNNGDGATPGIDGSNGGPDADVSQLDKFSFFVTSLKAMKQLSGNPLGFGGDLRFGETGKGAGIRGADKICAAIAELSMPGSSAKQWRAFLSATEDENGNQVNAIDRIGNGPWYDRLGRQLASSKAALMAIRPTDADAAIKNDFPNEDGVPNHDPDGTGEVDNHDFLTGSDSNGNLESADRTCLDWTGNTGARDTQGNLIEGRPRVGHSWPRLGGGGGGGGGSINSWISSLIESGCAPSVDLVEMGPPSDTANTVGNGGGYGGIYCFALNP